MKATTVIFSLLMVQVKGSFLDDFAGAMTSVENSFSKLVNDVVSDLTNTVHCTMLAMEQVLEMSGAVREPSNYSCYVQTDSVDNSYTLPSHDLKPTTENDNRNISSGKDIVQQISSSISNINKTLINILDNDGHERLNHVKSVLKHEASRFTEVSRLLKQELGKISNRLRKQIENIDPDKPSLESLWSDMKLLHNVEENDRNVSEVKEISKVLNEALNVLHLNTTSEVKSDDDKIETIVRQLEHESNENNDTLTNIDNELAQWKNKRSNLQNYSDENPKSFNDNIFKEIEKTQTEDDVTMKDESDKADSDYYSLFGETSKDEHQKAIDKARDIIEDSSNTEKMLDNFFANQEQTAVDIFNNPKLSDLGS